MHQAGHHTNHSASAALRRRTARHSAAGGSVENAALAASPLSSAIHRSPYVRPAGQTSPAVLPSRATSSGGDGHGGMVGKWIEQAGYASAVGCSGQNQVTVAFEASGSSGALVGGALQADPHRKIQLASCGRCPGAGTESSSKASRDPLRHDFHRTERRLRQPVRAAPLGRRPPMTTTVWPNRQRVCSTCRRRWKLKSPSFDAACRCDNRARRMPRRAGVTRVLRASKFIASGP